MGLKWGSNSAAYSSSWFKTVHFTAPLKVLPPQRNGNGNGECLSHLSPWIMRQSWRGLRSQSEVDSVQIHQDEMQRHTCFGRQTLNSQNDGLENVWRHSGIYNVPGYVNFLECWSVRIFISVLPKKKKKPPRLCGCAEEAARISPRDPWKRLLCAKSCPSWVSQLAVFSFNFRTVASQISTSYSYSEYILNHEMMDFGVLCCHLVSCTALWSIEHHDAFKMCSIETMLLWGVLPPDGSILR